MDGVKSVLVNNSSSTVEKYLRTSNIGLGKFILVKTNMELNYNSI